MVKSKGGYMKTVKEISEITGISIRTLRYYDEIGLLKPTQLTEANYRLYDNKALEKLQEIMFFKEVGMSLDDIKKILEDPDYDRKQALSNQKVLLERKRNRLNGIIELIDDIMEGVDTMSFEAFSDEDINKIFEHSLQLQDKESLDAIIQQYGSIEKCRESVIAGFKDEKQAAHLIKIYGSKDKAVEASLQATGDEKEVKIFQEEVDSVYKTFAESKQTGDEELAMTAVERLAKSYKKMFHFDNARYLLLKVAEDYLSQGTLVEATDEQYGDGVTEYIGHAIEKYYGV